MVINIKPQYVVRKIYCAPFSHVMDRCQYTRQLQQQRISFNTRLLHCPLVLPTRSVQQSILIHEACTIAFTKLGGANKIAHVQWPLCLPFPHVQLFYVTPALIHALYFFVVFIVILSVLSVLSRFICHNFW